MSIDIETLVRQCLSCQSEQSALPAAPLQGWLCHFQSGQARKWVWLIKRDL